MKRLTFNIPALLFALCLAPFPALAQPALFSVSQLLEELTASFGTAREAEAALKANIAQKAAYKNEQDTVNRENANYKRESADYARELGRHNDDVDKFNTECKGGNYTRQQLDRCGTRETQLKTAATALDARRRTLEEQRIAAKQLSDAFNQKEQARAQAAEALLSRYDAADARIKSTLARLTSDARFSHCASRPSPEAKQQCIQLAYQAGR